MNYKRAFAQFQQAYITKYPASLRMRSYLPSLSGKSILDVGCGSGIDMTFFAHQGVLKIAGVDIAQELLDVAKTSLPTADIRNENFSYLSWKEHSFDIVWSKYALNCANDITVPLKEIYRVLKPDGTVLLQVTHPLRSMSLLASRNYFEKGSLITYPSVDGMVFTEPHHTLTEWFNAITEAGFRITHCEEIINRPIEEYSGDITPSALIFILKK